MLQMPSRAPITKHNMELFSSLLVMRKRRPPGKAKGGDKQGIGKPKGGGHHRSIYIQQGQIETIIVDIDSVYEREGYKTIICDGFSNSTKGEIRL